MGGVLLPLRCSVVRSALAGLDFMDSLISSDGIVQELAEDAM
jgi:hypothetical protein